MTAEFSKSRGPWTAPNPFLAGLRGRCPRCGEGRLFAGFLALADGCDVCGLDYGAADSGDGPAVFVMFLVGFLVVPPALLLEVALTPPLWLHALVWTPLAVGLCLVLLRPFKAGLIALQFRHDAAEARLDE